MRDVRTDLTPSNNTNAEMKAKKNMTANQETQQDIPIRHIDSAPPHSGSLPGTGKSLVCRIVVMGSSMAAIRQAALAMLLSITPEDKSPCASIIASGVQGVCNLSDTSETTIDALL